MPCWKLQNSVLTAELRCVCACVLSRFSHVRLFATPWTSACQAPVSMGFSRQEYWVGCHSLLQRIFQTQGLHPALQADSLPLSHQRSPRFCNTFSKCLIWLFQKRGSGEARGYMKINWCVPSIQDGWAFDKTHFCGQDSKFRLRITGLNSILHLYSLE